jgi:hypothetical protein
MNWCIFYCKNSDPLKWHTMKLWRSDGVLVAAKTYDDVYKFKNYKEAWQFAKNLLTEEPVAKYNAEVRRVCRARNDAFYLAGN